MAGHRRLRIAALVTTMLAVLPVLAVQGINMILDANGCDYSPAFRRVSSCGLEQQWVDLLGTVAVWGIIALPVAMVLAAIALALWALAIASARLERAP